jgi:hypothetical protein
MTTKPRMTTVGQVTATQRDGDWVWCPLCGSGNCLVIRDGCGARLSCLGCSQDGGRTAHVIARSGDEPRPVPAPWMQLAAECRSYLLWRSGNAEVRGMLRAEAEAIRAEIAEETADLWGSRWYDLDPDGSGEAWTRRESAAIAEAATRRLDDLLRTTP